MGNNHNLLTRPPKTRFQQTMSIIFYLTHALLFALYTVILLSERGNYSSPGTYYDRFDSFFEYVSDYVLGFAVVSFGVTLILCAIASIPRFAAKRSHSPKEQKEKKVPKPAKQPKAPKPAAISRPVKQASPAPQQDSSIPLETLRQYKALLDEGLITEDEFHKLKSKILGL